MALPKIIFPASLLPIPDGTVKEINKIFYNFIWGNTDRIQRNVMINDLENGGLRMVDIESHMMALKGSWIKRIYTDGNDIWKHLPKTYLKSSTNNFLFDMSFNSINQMPRLNMIPKFYQEVVIGFSMANRNEIASKSDLVNQIIWGNQKFMVDGKCLFSKTFIESGFVHIYDILENNGKFKSNIYEYLNNKHNYLHTIHMIQAALKPYKKQRFSMESINQVEEQR